MSGKCTCLGYRELSGLLVYTSVPSAASNRLKDRERERDDSFDVINRIRREILSGNRQC